LAFDLLGRALSRDAPLIDEDDEFTQRILDAALAQFNDFGLRRTTVDDVARRGGLSRITIYRRFAKKEHLVEAVLSREVRRFLSGLAATAAGQSTPETRIVESIAFSLQYLCGHPLLNRLLETEPESIVPWLTVRGGPVVAAVREQVAAVIRPEIYGAAPVPAGAAQAIEVAAEMGVRLTLSFVLTRPSVVPLDTPDEARRFARQYIVPIYETLVRRLTRVDRDI
jgi:AcrR family transcriptional regulator